jgi:hypothetical protein
MVDNVSGHIVFVAPRFPLYTDTGIIPEQRLLIATPHTGSWMIDPPFGQAGECPINLIALNTLFTKALPI